MRILSSFATLVAIVMSQGAFAQDQPLELTPAGKAILHSNLASDGQLLRDRPGLIKPVTFPLAMCTFPSGLCGAVHRDGTVAVPPRYDWVGTFSERGAALRLRRRKRARDRQATVSHRRRLQIRLRAGRRGWQVRLDRSRRQDGRRAEVRLHRGDRSRSLPCFGRTAARRNDRWRELFPAFGSPHPAASACQDLVRFLGPASASSISRGGPSSRRARLSLASSIRTIRRSAGCKRKSCGASHAPTEAGSSSRSSSRQMR